MPELSLEKARFCMEDEWQRWQRFAKEDQSMGFDNLELYPRGASYQLQQSAAKFLKAVLIAKGIEPVLTHDLRTVLTQIEPAIDRSSRTMKAARLLTFFGGQSRYPSDYSEVNFEQAKALYEANLEIEAYATRQLEKI